MEYGILPENLGVFEKSKFSIIGAQEGLENGKGKESDFKEITNLR
jgi:hypothetical protein